MNSERIERKGGINTSISLVEVLSASGSVLQGHVEPKQSRGY